VPVCGEAGVQYQEFGGSVGMSGAAEY
jgi:hypothetical protein